MLQYVFQGDSVCFCLNPPVVCFDAKFNFDDSARFRQKEVFAMDDQSESDPREVEAGKYDLNYIGLDGDIACLGEIYGLLTKHEVDMTGYWPTSFSYISNGLRQSLGP